MSRNSENTTSSGAQVRHVFEQRFDHHPHQSADDSTSSRSQIESEKHAAVDDAHHQSDQAICRICLESSTTDIPGGESLGRLLSPCRCKGTMKYVHATCLDQWRAASARSSSAIACDQCGAPYRFRKSKFVGLATSPALLFLVTLCLFLVLIWTVGAIATFCMHLYDQPTLQTPHGSPLDTHAWSYPDTDYSTSSWSYSTLVYEPAAYVRLVKEAVRSFASGEAAHAVREVVGWQHSSQSSPSQQRCEEKLGFWDAIKNEWMYGDGGLWQQSTSSTWSSVAKASKHIDTSDTCKHHKQSRDRYDARSASEANNMHTPKQRRHRQSNRTRRRSTHELEAPSQSWLNKLIVQFSVGFCLVGILSFVNLLVGASFVGALNLPNFGLGRWFARITSNRRGSNPRQDGANIASILMVLLVVIGVVSALHVVYRLVRRGARCALSRLEAVIVDWNHDDDDDDDDDDDGVAAQ